MLEQAVRARFDQSGQQVVNVTVHRGYRPDSIRARAGLPLRVVFRRQDEDACSERVIFSSPHLARRLLATGATTIDLPAQPAGEIRFTCGMGRYRGRIELVDERRPPVLTRLRTAASRLQTPLGTALVLSVCSLLLIALVAVVTLDVRTTFAIAGAALVTLAAGCLWAFRSTKRPT